MGPFWDTPIPPWGSGLPGEVSLCSALPTGTLRGAQGAQQSHPPHLPIAVSALP